MSRDGATLTLDPAQLVSMMFALLPVPVAITDGRGRVILCNSCFTDVFQGIPEHADRTAARRSRCRGAGLSRFRRFLSPIRATRLFSQQMSATRRNLRKRVAGLEKMAAIGRVVTGVATELEAPLADIASYAFLVERASFDAGDAADRRHLALEKPSVPRIWFKV